jgi:hypothetical protein
MKDAIRIASRSITPGMLPNMNSRTWRSIIICAEGDYVVEGCVPDSKTMLYETIQYFTSKCKLI